MVATVRSFLRTPAVIATAVAIAVLIVIVLLMIFLVGLTDEEIRIWSSAVQAVSGLVLVALTATLAAVTYKYAKSAQDLVAVTREAPRVRQERLAAEELLVWAQNSNLEIIRLNADMLRLRKMDIPNVESLPTDETASEWRPEASLKELSVQIAGLFGRVPQQIRDPLRQTVKAVSLASLVATDFRQSFEKTIDTHGEEDFLWSLVKANYNERAAQDPELLGNEQRPAWERVVAREHASEAEGALHDLENILRNFLEISEPD